MRGIPMGCDNRVIFLDMLILLATPLSLTVSRLSTIIQPDEGRRKHSWMAVNSGCRHLA